MKALKLFMPKRQIFMAGPEKGGEDEKQQPKVPGGGGEFTPGEAKQQGAKVVAGSQALLDQFQPEKLDNKQDFDKPMSDAEIKEKSKGYPKVKIDSSNQAIVDELRGRIAKDVKDRNIDNPNLHRGSANMIDTLKTDNYEYVLVIDATVKPPNGPNLLFKSPKQFEPQKEAVDLNEAVGSLIKPYNELPANNPEYKKTLNELKPKVKNHGDSQMTGEDVNGVKTGWVLLKDDTATAQNGFRVFKGTPV